MASGPRMVSDRNKPTVDQHELDHALRYVSSDAGQSAPATGRRVSERSPPSCAKQLVTRHCRVKTNLDCGARDPQRHGVAKRMVHLEHASRTADDTDTELTG